MNLYESFTKKLNESSEDVQCYWVDLDVRKGDESYSDNISSQTVATFDDFASAVSFAKEQAKTISRHLAKLPAGEWYEYTIREVYSDDEWDDREVVPIEGQEPMNESQTQEIESIMGDLKKRNPKVETYLSEYYKIIDETEPKHERALWTSDAWVDEWNAWYQDTANILYSEKAWNKFIDWVRKTYGDKEADSLEPKDK